jgi:hypothetical protein
MLHKLFEPGDWFAPKRFGIGAGWPIAWQGWALLAAYVLLIAGLVKLAPADRATVVLGMIAATALLILIIRKRTRGGWRWRMGEED